MLGLIPALTGCTHLKQFFGINAAPLDEVPPEATEGEFPPVMPEMEELSEAVPAANSSSAPEASFVPAFAADPPELLYRPVPMFQESADLDAIAGSEARFRIVVNEAGAVLEAVLLETTHPANVTAARDAILQSRYRPMRTPQGFAIQVTLEETLEF